jgi:lipopolysaccharide export LptBFGC system permease protein LptF
LGYPSRGKGSNYGNQRQRSGNKFSSHSSKSTFKSVPSFVTPDDSVWVTIRGTHVLIKDGETASQAFKRTTGKDLSEPEKKIYDKPDGDNAKSLNTGNDKGSGGDKTNMQNELPESNPFAQVLKDAETGMYTGDPQFYFRKKMNDVINQQALAGKTGIIDSDDYKQLKKVVSAKIDKLKTERSKIYNSGTDYWKNPRYKQSKLEADALSGLLR